MPPDSSELWQVSTPGIHEWEHSYDIAPSINIAVPTRYLHSHNGVIHRDDFANPPSASSPKSSDALPRKPPPT